MPRHRRSTAPLSPASPRQIPADLRLYYQHRSPPVFTDGPSNLQNYFPSLELLFPTLADQTSLTPTLVASELAVEISGGHALVESLQSRLRRANVPIWIRTQHLLPPWDYLDGHYIVPGDGALPAPREALQRTLRKINNPYNEAYTDALFACMASRLVETGRSPHWCRFYGTFSGRMARYSYNITDTLPEYQDKSWFRRGLAEKRFHVEVADPDSNEREMIDDRYWIQCTPKRRIVGDTGSSCGHHSDTLSELSLIDASDNADVALTELSDLEEYDDALDVSGDSPIEISRPVGRVRIRSADVSGSDASSISSSSDGYPLSAYAVLPDYPCQMTILERCDGMMDSLMDDEQDPEVATDDMRETKEARWTAWIFQVIAGLTVAQELYGFIHNDLHTGNVMWCGTPEPYLYYHLASADRYYRVPTYGRIMKIIDFGRATFCPTAAATADQRRIWYPDAYGPGGDADGMFNGGKMYEPDDFEGYTHPKTKPNRSFDLARLAVAMLEALWPEPPIAKEPRRVLTREQGRSQHETVSPLWNLLWLWLTGRDGRNLLYAPDGSDRYAEFEQYCAITRDASNAVPAQQLTLPLFDAAFRCTRRDVPAGTHVWEL